MTKDKTVGWHHRLNGYESEQTPGNSEGQGSLACCSPWSHSQTRLSDWATTTATSKYFMVVYTVNLSPAP